MSADVGGVTVAIFTALFGVAIVAVLVSQNANTSQIIAAIGGSTGNVIGAATAPVTGGGQGNVGGFHIP